MDEKEKVEKVEEQEDTVEDLEMLTDEKKEKGKISFAYKWLIVCGVLFVLLVVLAILVDHFNTGELWPNSYYTGPLE